MTRLNDVSYCSFNKYDWEHRKEKEILSVLINGEFKTMVFIKVGDKCFIVIGDTDAYTAAMYWNSWSVKGWNLLDPTTQEWYETSKDEGNAIYAKVVATEKMSKRGRPYYRFSM